MLKGEQMETFCEHCNKFTEYRILEIVDKAKVLGGRIITYTKWEARCVECGEEVYASKIDEHNIKEMYKLGYDDGYREAKKKYY